MNVFSVEIIWTTPAGEEQHDQFVTQEAYVLRELNRSLTNNVAPTMGNVCDIHIVRAGTYRDTGA